jgi:hypothetical protein
MLREYLKLQVFLKKPEKKFVFVLSESQKLCQRVVGCAFANAFKVFLHNGEIQA